MSDIWFCCKKTDKVVELSDCLECKEPKNCLSLASYQQGRADAIDEFVETMKVYYGINIMNDIDKLAEQLKEQKND